MRNCIPVMWIVVIYLGFQMASAQAETSNYPVMDMKRATEECSQIYGEFLQNACPHLESQVREAGKIECIKYFSKNGINDDTLADQFMAALASCSQSDGWMKWLMDNKCTIGGAVAGAALAPLAAPAVMGVLGFTSAGITAGSWAASMMSAAATYGAGGWAVAALQSVGAAGVGVKTILLGIFAGTYFGSKTCTEGLHCDD